MGAAARSLIVAAAVAASACATTRADRVVAADRATYAALARAQDLAEAACDAGRATPPACAAFDRAMADALAAGARVAGAGLTPDRVPALHAFDGALPAVEAAVAAAGWPDDVRRQLALLVRSAVDMVRREVVR